MLPILPPIFDLIPAKAYKAIGIGASVLAILLIGGAAIHHWHNQVLVARDKAHQMELQAQTAAHVNKINNLQGQIDQLGITVSDKTTKLADSNAKLTKALAVKLPPMPPAPTAGVDPCAEVRVVAKQREDVLTEQKVEAVAAKDAAEAIIPPLTLQFNLATQQKVEAVGALNNQMELNGALKLDLIKAEDSAFKWKVGGITVGVAGLIELLRHH